MKQYIIVGSGILGAMTAYRLAKKGVNVTLIDEQKKGRATTAAAGIICPWLTQRRNKAWFHLAKEGARFYPELVEELANDGETYSGYQRVGGLILKNKYDKLIKTYERGIERLKDAPEMEELTLLTSEETKKMFPLIHGDFESIHVKGAARIDGAALNKALINGAKKHGANFISGHASLLYQANQATGVTLNGERLYADRIICTTGAWMKETLAPLGIQFKVRPQRGQILHFSPPITGVGTWPVMMSLNNLSIVPFSDRLVIGATHENDAGFSADLTASGVHDILNKALEVIPGLADWPLLDAKVGFRPLTPDSIPVIGTVPGFENLIIANGLGASGLTTGPYVGEQLAKLALDLELDIDLDNYSVDLALEN